MIVEPEVSLGLANTTAVDTGVLDLVLERVTAVCPSRGQRLSELANKELMWDA